MTDQVDTTMSQIEADSGREGWVMARSKSEASRSKAPSLDVDEGERVAG